MIRHDNISAFIATTASIAGLVDVMPKLADIFEKAPWLEMALAQLAPILIILSNEILKVILEVLSGLEGPGECDNTQPKCQ
jgi:hypothetical protein